MMLISLPKRKKKKKRIPGLQSEEVVPFALRRVAGTRSPSSGALLGWTCWAGTAQSFGWVFRGWFLGLAFIPFPHLPPLFSPITCFGDNFPTFQTHHGRNRVKREKSSQPSSFAVSGKKIWYEVTLKWWPKGEFRTFCGFLQTLLRRRDD